MSNHVKKQKSRRKTCTSKKMVIERITRGRERAMKRIGK
jgi:hypothetical protein